MSSKEVEELCENCGFEIVEIHVAGVLPLSDKFMLHPVGAIHAVERLLSMIPALAPLAHNVIYVCRQVTDEAALRSDGRLAR